MSYVDKFHYARINPGAVDTYFVHDGLPIKIGTGLSSNTLEFGNTATGGTFRVLFFAPSLGHAEVGG